MKKQVSYLQKLFYDLWNDFGSVYLIVNNSERTQIGKRGFTEDEKKHGLILVFNDKTNNKLDWDEEGNLSCVLAFGTRKEDIYIHHDDLIGVFSPDAGVQFLRGDVDRNLLRRLSRRPAGRSPAGRFLEQVPEEEDE